VTPPASNPLLNELNVHYARAWPAEGENIPSIQVDRCLIANGGRVPCRAEKLAGGLKQADGTCRYAFR